MTESVSGPCDVTEVTGNGWGCSNNWTGKDRAQTSASPAGCPGPPRRWSTHSSDAQSWCQSEPLQRRRPAAAQEPAANHWADRTGGEERGGAEGKQGQGLESDGEKNRQRKISPHTNLATFVTCSHSTSGWLIQGQAAIHATKQVVKTFRLLTERCQ